MTKAEASEQLRLLAQNMEGALGDDEWVMAWVKQIRAIATGLKVTDPWPPRHDWVNCSSCGKPLDNQP